MCESMCVYVYKNMCMFVLSTNVCVHVYVLCMYIRIFVCINEFM